MDILNAKKQYLKSKKGMALPTAIVVACVLVLLTTALITLAISSTANSSADVDDRQAYINAKSALDYACSYYTNGGEIPGYVDGDPTGEEILQMNAADGSAEQGATVRDIGEEATVNASSRTYVHSVYNESQSTLKLTAYSKSADAFGAHQKTQTLTVTYSIGSSSSSGGRRTNVDLSIPKDPQKTSGKDITIHVRRVPGDHSWTPLLYMWTYKKIGGVDWNHINKDGSAETDFSKLTVQQLNAIESDGNKMEPCAPWITGQGGKNGPATAMVAEGDSGDWFQYTFTPQDNMVPWFNCIVAKPGPDCGSKKPDTQTSEFLDLWYLNSGDRHIYCEMLQEELQYYENRNWNGTDTLKDRVLIYAKSIQTNVYAKLKGVDDDSAHPKITASGTSVSSRNMDYVGYGWWVARVPSNSAFTATFDVVGASGSQTVSCGITSAKPYVVFEESGSSMTCTAYSTEENAARVTGSKDYVTVYAKALNGKASTKPMLSYTVNTINTSAAKNNLASLIKSCNSVDRTVYTVDSVNDFAVALNHAIQVYNMTTLQSDDVYNNEITALTTAKNNLVLEALNLADLNTKIADAQSKLANRGSYTSESIVKLENKLRSAQKLVTNATAAGSTIVQAQVDNMATQLQAAIDALATLDKTGLLDKINEAIAIRSAYTTPGTPEYNALDTAIASAQNVYNNSTSTTEINKAISDLQKAINKAKNIDTSVLQTKIADAKTIVNHRSKYVSKTIDNLQNVITAAENELNGSITDTKVQAYIDALDDATSKLIFKPEDTMSPADSNHTRIWFDMSALGDKNYYVHSWGTGGDLYPWGTKNDETKMNKDASSGYYYYDLNTAGGREQFLIYDGTSTKYSGDLKYDGTNNFFKVNSASSADKGKMVTVYSSANTGWPGDRQAITVTNSMVNVTDVRLDKNSEGTYFVQRIVVKSGAKAVINNANTVDYKETKQLTSLPGEDFVILYNDTTAANIEGKIYKLSELDNAAQTTVIPTEKTSEAKVSKLDGNNDYQIVKTSFINDPKYPSTLTVYFDKPSGWGDPKIWAWQTDASGATVSGTDIANKFDNAPMMTRDDGDRFYYEFRSNQFNAFLIYSSTNKTQKTPDIKLVNISSAVDSSTGKYYPDLKLDTSGNAVKYTAPIVTPQPGDVTMTYKDLPMAFVGGQKQTFTNESDYARFGDRGRKDSMGRYLNGSAQFSNYNDTGFGRVGFTKHETLYDWYAYKIPVGKSDEYTISVKGLDGNRPNIETKQIQKVWGDVYVQLKSSSKDGGKYNDVAISTVDPEINVLADNTTIYVRQPSSWTDASGVPLKIRVKMWGLNSNDVELSSSNMYGNYYKLTVPKSMPFLQFYSEDNSRVCATTSLQGGNYILYDCEGGIGGSGEWEEYIPEYVIFQEARAEAESIGDGWIIYEYDPTTKLAQASSACVAQKIKSMALTTLPENNIDENTDPTVALNRAKELQEWCDAYKKLYNIISNARVYIDQTNTGSYVYYPEHDSMPSGISYKIDDIRELYTLIKNAKGDYSSTGVTLDQLKEHFRKIDAKLSAMTPETTTSAIFILYPNDPTWGSSDFVIRYKISETDTIYQTMDVTYKNSDGYYIIYVDTGAEGKIYDVAFGYNGGASWGDSKDVVEKNEDWFYTCADDGSLRRGWARNSSANYREVNATTLTQVGFAEYKLEGDTPAANFVINFRKDCVVTYSGGSYTILAGAYPISYTEYKNYKGMVGDYVDLYSDKAKEYFTDIEHQGFSKTGEFSDGSPGWTINKAFSTVSGSFSDINDVNFWADSGELIARYTSDTGIYFRWSGSDDLMVYDGAKFTAPYISIASSSTITGGTQISPEFIFENNNPDTSADFLVRFVTDTKVSYQDDAGDDILFTIYAGTYKLKPPQRGGNINLFDKDYWLKEAEMVETVVNTGGGAGKLTNPVYEMY